MTTTTVKTITAKLRLWLAVLALAVAAAKPAAAQVPEKPNPPRLVNDYAGIIADAAAMEDTLEAFARRTSNHIVVVTLADLGGMDKAQMAQQIGETWGVGQKEYSNGLVILVKPKPADGSGTGEVFIATGYGLEGALPDAACHQIVTQQMIPQFQAGDYSAGIWDALHIIMPVAAGEYSFEEAQDQLSEADYWIGIGVFLLILVVAGALAFGRKTGGGGRGNGGRGGGGDYTMGPLFFGGHYGGSGDSSWSSGSSGLGGGFGGFGGGSFGGGGAGGSW